jgi:large subunit ribosomal protein L10
MNTNLKENLSMALSKDKKQVVVEELQNALKTAKIAVLADYTGLTVKQLQELRKSAAENGTSVRVVKNRLARIAFESTEGFKDADLSNIQGQMIYALNDTDEVAPAQALAGFAKKNPQLKLTAAIDSTGSLLDESQVNHLASLPSKDQLRGQLVGTIAAPLSGFVSVLSGNMRGLVTVLSARAEKLEA